jgi:hypothetical protein
MTNIKMFIWAVVSCVSVILGYTTWALEMCQYDYRAHEGADSMMIHIHRDWMPFKIQSKSYKHESVILSLRLDNKYISTWIYFLLCFTDYSRRKNGLLLHSSLERSLYCEMLHLIPHTFFMWSHNYTHLFLGIKTHYTKLHKYLRRGCK